MPDADHRHLSMLARATRLLETPLDLAATAWQTAELVVAELADWCLVEVRGSDHQRLCVLAHHDPALLATAELLRQPEHLSALLELMTVLPAMTPVDLAGAGHNLPPALGDAWCALTVPLTSAGRPVGSMILLRARSRPSRGDDVQLAVGLGQRAGAAVERARLYADLQETTRVLQASLLPPALPRVPGLTVSAQFRSGTAGSDIGGDYYDVFRTGPDRWWVVLGDVCGKGAAAAALSAAVRHSLHAIAPDTDDPAVVLRRLNDELLGEDRDGRFTTLLLLTFLAGGRREAPLQVWMASGGHPAPILRAADGTVSTVPCPGTLVGAVRELSVATVRLDLMPGDTLVLYTDGVTEARDPCGVELGECTLARLLAGHRGDDTDLARALAHEVLRLADGELRDDLALLTLTR
ncbi:MAG TPA: SpoIIE family protein phosphatase [Oryzihumus sp.]|nr:SpoIIE family protein phosphatase [Oryzihumus sp.]